VEAETSNRSSMKVCRRMPNQQEFLAGAAREEILPDYLYLEAEDITAVVEFAARQNDHPVLRSA
jgi:hypothetical protein